MSGARVGNALLFSRVSCKFSDSVEEKNMRYVEIVFKVSNAGNTFKIGAPNNLAASTIIRLR